MKKLALALILVCAFTLTFAVDVDKPIGFSNDTLYTIQLGIFKGDAFINDELKSKYEELGFWENANNSQIFNTTGSASLDEKMYTYPLEVYTWGTFQSEEEALKAKTDNAVINDFLVEAKIVKITTSENSKLALDGIKHKSVDSFFEPVVGAIASVLFYDPFALFGVSGKIILESDGLPAIDHSGNPIRTSVPFIVVWLVIGAIFFTLYMKFINIRGIKHAIRLVAGKEDTEDNKAGEVSHFQALTTALSATVGLGNIAGVAVAISMGGPGATFWMILAGFLGMSSKFVECTLGVKYRKVDENGEVSGGPMYYLSKGLAKKNMGGLGKVLAIMFAIFCVFGSFGGGNMFQANQAFAQLSTSWTALEGNGVIFGIVLALLVGVVIVGGIRSIARVTDKIVPLMAILYVGVALVIIIMNFTKIGDVFGLIVEGAFSPDAVKGGVLGVLILGFKRASFSNEAGVGSASIAHAAVKTDEPITEGLVSLLEPFIDTIVICTMTALVLIFTGYHESSFGLSGAPLTSAAFGSVFSWFPYLLVVAILLFAFSTMISWSYYGLKSWTYLLGDSKLSVYSYKLVFLVFIVIGSSVQLGAVIDFSDMMILAMAFPNILGLYFLSSEVKDDLKAYLAKKKEG